MKKFKIGISLYLDNSLEPAKLIDALSMYEVLSKGKGNLIYSFMVRVNADSSHQAIIKLVNLVDSTGYKIHSIYN